MNNVGSGQQVVTTVFKPDSYDSIWTVKEAERASEPCRTGEPIKCGDYIRLENNNTGKNLHSHQEYKSALSGRQEVTGYGDDGSGDAGDDWEILCNDEMAFGKTLAVGEPVMGSTLFFLRHVDTGKFLLTDKAMQFNQQNCPRCPINGQCEIAAARGKTS